jgi:hypothetical protein
MEVKVRKKKIIHNREQTYLLQSWNASMEEIANRWLEELRVRNKDVYLFCTKLIKKKCKNNNKIKNNAWMRLVTC